MVINIVIDDDFVDDFLFDSFYDTFSRIMCDVERLRLKHMSCCCEDDLKILYMFRKNLKHAYAYKNFFLD